MRHLVIQILLIILATALIAILARGQLQIHDTLRGDSAGDFLGSSIASVGDVDGDGRDDLVVGAPFDTFAGATSGSAYLVSGGTGAILDAVHGTSGDFLGFHVAAAGDIDGDGTPDFIVGSEAAASLAGRYWIYSGDGSGLIRTGLGPAGANTAYACAVAGLGDLDGDGHAEYAVGASGTNSSGTAAGRVFVHDGATGVVVKTFDGAAAFDRFGCSVAGLGDLDGDGIPDLAIGATGSDLAFVDAGSVFVHSGADWSLIRAHHGAMAGARFGSAVAAAGDVDRDSRPDLLVGAEDDGLVAPGAGRATVHSGAQGLELLALAGSAANDHLGCAVAGGADFDGDGFADVVIGARGNDAGGTDAGAIFVHSWKRAQLVATVLGDAAGDQLGTAVALLFDADGDGFADPAAGAPRAGVVGANAGLTRIWRAPTMPVRHYATRTGLAHRLDLIWSPDGGDLQALTGTLNCSRATPGGYGLYGVSFAAADIAYWGYLPVLIADDPLNLIETGAFGFLYGGQIAIQNVTRQYPWIAGWSVHLQFYETAPIISSSNGVRLLMAP